MWREARWHESERALKLALLSTAGINAKLVAGARLVDEVELVAIGSRDRARAEAQAAELGVERALGSYEEVLADPDVDAVYVPLPNSMHVEWSIRALEAGKHVLCEKPMSRRPEEVKRAFDAAERAGRVLAEGFMWRHHPQARRLVDLIPRVGELSGPDHNFGCDYAARFTSGSRSARRASSSARSPRVKFQSNGSAISL
ncbi:MAG: Gfo/Idh/MocA family oxidoreductase [Thermoleophilaceae bacterium]